MFFGCKRCCPGRYHVFTTNHFGYGTSCRSPFTIVPQTQWDEARAQAWNSYHGSCTSPEGWVFKHAYTGGINPETGDYEVVLGDMPLAELFWDGIPNTFFPPFERKSVNGHVGMAASGIFFMKGISFFESCATATYGNIAWVFMVPAEEGASLLSKWGFYELDFFLRIQPSDFGVPGVNNVPFRFIKHAEQLGITNSWPGGIVSEITELGGYRMVVGNAGGKLITSLTEIPSGAVTDTTSATYWVTKHLINHDYKDVVGIPPPPRSGDIVRLQMATDGNGTQFSDFFEETTTEGLDSTSEITDPQERLLGIPNGSVWFLAIVPEEMCMNDILPADLEFQRLIQPRDPWFSQELGLNKTSSLNIARLEARQTGITDTKTLAPPVGNPTLDL